MRTIEIYFSENCQTTDIAASEITALLHKLDEYSQRAIPDGELSIAFLNEAELAQLHGEFLDDDSPTDVMTFIGDPEENLAGEICISVDRAREEASERHISFMEELTLYLVHGWLHLSGLDDREPEERALMRKEEKAALAFLQNA